MTNRKCKKLHWRLRQGICMRETFQCRLFSIAVQEDYCNICRKAKRAWMIFFHWTPKKDNQKIQKNKKDQLGNTSGFVVTQDRQNVHDSARFISILIDNGKIIAKIDWLGGLFLGEYKTNERAIEVRDQMLCSTQTFYMPEE